MRKIYAMPLMLMSLCVSTLSNAAPVPIVNAGFETDVFADGTSGPVATGWATSGNVGTFNPNNTTQMPPTGAPEGDNTLFINIAGDAAQVLPTNLVANTIYTLDVDVCDRADLADGNYLIELLAGVTVISSDANTLAPLAPGTTCLTSTISYTSLVGDPNVGSALQIRFSLTGGRQVNFDDIRLDASAVPAAAPVPTLTQWMLGLLMVCLMLVGYRFRGAAL